MSTLILWAVVAVGIAVSRRYWPHLWAHTPWRSLPPAPREHAEAWPRGADRARTTRIGNAAPGDYVAIVGTVADAMPLTAPASQRPCVAFDAVLNRAVGGDQLGRVLRASRFTVEDGSGSISVDARGAYVRVVHDRHFEGGPACDAMHDYLALRLQPEPDGSRPAMFADEGVIAAGDRVLVIGVVEAASADADEVGYRLSADVRLRITGGGKRPTMVSNVPADVRTRG